MPSKGRGKGQSRTIKVKEKLKTEWDDISIASLHEVVSQLDSEYEILVGERVFAQTEHDAVNTYCNVTKNNIHSLDMQITLIEHEIECLEEGNAVELKVYDEKTKHLSYDHTLKLRDYEEHKLVSTLKEKQEHDEQLASVEQKKVSIREELREIEIVYSEEIKQMKCRYNDELMDNYGKLNVELDKFREKCEKDQKEIEDQLDLKKYVERRELEEQRNAHIFNLEKRHREACEQTKSHYEEMYTENSTTSRQLQDDNNRLAQVEMLKGKIKDKEKNRISLRNVKIRRIVTEDRLRQQIDDYEELQNKFDAVKIERDELQANIAGIMAEVASQNSDSTKYLQQKFRGITESVAKTGLQLSTFLVSRGINEKESKHKSLLPNSVHNNESTIGRQKLMVIEIQTSFLEMLEIFRKESKVLYIEEETCSIPLQSLQI